MKTKDCARCRETGRRPAFVAEDTGGDNFTMNVVKGEIISFESGMNGTPDIIVTTTSENFCDMFWGDLNPSQKYLQGEIRVKASQEDVVRLDAITMIIYWPIRRRKK